MTREIEFRLDTIDRICIWTSWNSKWSNKWYRAQKRIFAGYEGENEATQLSFKFGEEFDGYTITLLFDSYGTETESDPQTEDFTYDMPSALMVPEVVRMRIKAVNDEEISLSTEIILEIKR
jgi:hypothetical protein